MAFLYFLVIVKHSKTKNSKSVLREDWAFNLGQNNWFK
jgi:hypothetical protein